MHHWGNWGRGLVYLLTIMLNRFCHLHCILCSYSLSEGEQYSSRYSLGCCKCSNNGEYCILLRYWQFLQERENFTLYSCKSHKCIPSGKETQQIQRREKR